MNFQYIIVLLLDDSHSEYFLVSGDVLVFLSVIFTYTQDCHYRVQTLDSTAAGESPSGRLPLSVGPRTLYSETAYIPAFTFCLALLALLFKLCFDLTEYYVRVSGNLQENSS